MPSRLKADRIVTSARVLAIPYGCLEHLWRRAAFYTGTEEFEYCMSAIQRCGQYVDRDWAESTESVKQVIAYAIVRSDRSVLCLRRTKNSERASLRLKYTLLFGGHVDDNERGSSKPLVDCLKRELIEELGVSLKVEPRPLGIVVDPTTAVGRLHLGVIFEVSIDQDAVTLHPGLDNCEFTNPRRNRTYKMMSGPSLRRISRQLDPWSSLIAESAQAKRILGPEYSFPVQEFFAY